MGGGASRAAPDDAEPPSPGSPAKKSRRASRRASSVVPLSVGEELHSGNADRKQALMESAFSQIDVNGDGLITREEIKEAFERMDIEIETNELIQLMDRVDVDRSNEISIDEFSNMSALKLHLLAQGLAEAKNTSIMAKAPKPKPNRSAMSEIWKRVSTRTSHGDERRVVSATSLIAMLGKPSRNSAAEGSLSGRLSQGGGGLWSRMSQGDGGRTSQGDGGLRSSLMYSMRVHSAQAKVGATASLAGGKASTETPTESEASPVTPRPPPSPASPVPPG
tara:strand:- start:271 stop:1104 length:834 start_codon:yes stop_codon:yes gene_type:complete